MEELYARAVEQMLEGEMDSHLGYEKHSPEGVNSGNSRNGKSSKGIVFKVRQNDKVINKTVYLAVGLNSEGHKEMLGMWLGESESASFWMSVMTDLRARGVEDILITSTDNLKGFTEVE